MTTTKTEQFCRHLKHIGSATRLEQKLLTAAVFKSNHEVDTRGGKLVIRLGGAR